jgi:hypothetical protein
VTTMTDATFSSPGRLIMFNVTTTETGQARE